MITTIAKQFTFDATHFIPTVPEHHKCRRMHGHTYKVELQFTGTTDEKGFCCGIDYGDIGALWSRIHAQIDHRTLNEVIGLEVPTTENLVVWIGRAFVKECGTEHVAMRRALTMIRIAESDTTWCEALVTHELLHG